MLQLYFAQCNSVVGPNKMYSTIEEYLEPTRPSIITHREPNLMEPSLSPRFAFRVEAPDLRPSGVCSC